MDIPKIKGFNKADNVGLKDWESKARNSDKIKKRPCVFLSHKREDKPACRKIANYLSNAGIDYYLDEKDEGLQAATLSGDAHKITEHIKNGIKNSSHMLCVVSKATFKSKWVPFEIGYGQAAIIDTGESYTTQPDMRLSILTLSDLSGVKIPEFMEIAYLIRDLKEIHKYIRILTNSSESELVQKERIISGEMKSSHPLSQIVSI